jgi:hypothetical protein
MGREAVAFGVPYFDFVNKIIYYIDIFDVPSGLFPTGLSRQQAYQSQ